MVAHVLDENLRHVRTIRMWREELLASKRPPFDIGPDTLFVAYSAWAELTCFMVLGWPFPTHIFDLHTAYLSATNVLQPYDPHEVRKKPRKRLPDACRAYGIEGWEKIDKDTIAEDIGNGHWRRYGQEAVFEYCEEDVRKSVQLLRAQLWRHQCGPTILPAADVPRVLWWSNYSAKAVAQIQARGMPIDVERWNLVQENKQAVVDELLRRFDPSHGSEEPIYTPEGEWSYARFERFLIRSGVTAWPRLESGKLDIDGDAFRMMSHIPGIEALHALRDTLGVIVRAKLPIGHDGRNRPSLFPFCTAAGRNAHAKSLFNAHASVRSFMAFSPDAIGVYLDWRTQEVGIAAALSEDRALIEAYRDGDVYHSLALVCGLTDDTDVKRWKRECSDVRQRMKALQLRINYGMCVPSLARGLDRHPIIASNFIEDIGERIRDSGTGVTTKSKWRCWSAESRLYSDGLSISPPARTSARCIIFRCKETAPKCCAWRRAACATPASSRACSSTTAFCWRRETTSRSSMRSRSCARPDRTSATAWKSASTWTSGLNAVRAIKTNARSPDRCGRRSWACSKPSGPYRERRRRE